MLNSDAIIAQQSHPKDFVQLFFESATLLNRGGGLLSYPTPWQCIVVVYCVNLWKLRRGGFRWQSTWYSTQILPPSSSLRMTCGKSWVHGAFCKIYTWESSIKVPVSYWLMSENADWQESIKIIVLCLKHSKTHVHGFFFVKIRIWHH